MVNLYYNQKGGDIMKVKLNRIECKRCGYKWTPRKVDIRQCPKCKTAYWEIGKEKKDGLLDIK
jgi:predicted Zn-ribbon and HTH transcriptional regulator